MSFKGFSDEEISAVKNRFPKFELVRIDTWRGDLDFYAEFSGHAIRDQYLVSITVPGGYPNEIPAMRETGGRTKAIADKYKITDLRDLHCNPDGGVACVCVKQEEKARFPTNSNLLTFVDQLAVPYLYGLSYFDEFKKWPWPEYAHGPLGILERYTEDLTGHTRGNIIFIAPSFTGDVKNRKKYREHLLKPGYKKLCPCGSGKFFSVCHPLAWDGLLCLRADLRRLGLDPKTLF
jgi:hypothetical protein